jgi:phenylpropionate dioxygenase-like ring-hydroxylating dioxygenase large terminal subunit
MNAPFKPDVADQSVREDFVPVGDYISSEFLQAEKARMWPRVWQMACREEEIPKVGDYVTYEIFEESIIVVRTAADRIEAYYNVCPHRGRRLATGCGHTVQFHCRFHGWKWRLDGKPAEVVDRHDWGESLKDEEISLARVRCETWGGWVFVNQDETAEPLAAFLEPAKAMLDPFEFDKMRYKWRKQIVAPCNWKVGLEAFDEAYHVQTTHRQLLDYHDDLTYSAAQGKHGMFGFGPDKKFGLNSPRLGPVQGDVRKGLHEFNREIYETLDATTTNDMLEASKRLMELPETASYYEVVGAFAQFHMELAAKRGVEWPNVSIEQLIAAGTDWHIFPNMVFLHQPTNLLGYRARPNGDDPDSCIFDVYALERYAPGEEPKAVEVEVKAKWEGLDEWGLILQQDFENMEFVQLGMKSKGFKGARTNPAQERAVSNFHATLHAYINGND